MCDFDFWCHTFLGSVWGPWQFCHASDRSKRRKIATLRFSQAPQKGMISEITVTHFESLYISQLFILTIASPNASFSDQYTYIYLYICLNIYIYPYVCMYIYVYTYTHMHTYTCSIWLALHWLVLRLVTSALQHTATHCNTLQHTATHCNALQRTATHRNTLQQQSNIGLSVVNTATHCNTLQRTTTHCNTH